MGFDQVKRPSGLGLKEKENSLAKMISFWGKKHNEYMWLRKNGDVWKGCIESQEERRCLEVVQRVRRREISGKGV